MIERFRFLRRVFVDLPAQARLGYCLMRDPRVPVATKAAFGAGLGLLVAPKVPVPRGLPLVGELDAVAILILGLRLFIAACPDDVVLDLEQAIIEQRSVFDDDLRAGERVATRLFHLVRR